MVSDAFGDVFADYILSGGRRIYDRRITDSPFRLSFASLFGMISFSIVGFSFPVQGMDPTLQALARLFPLRHYFLIYVDQALNGRALFYTLGEYAWLLGFSDLAVPYRAELEEGVVGFQISTVKKLYVMKREHRLRYIIKEGLLDTFYIWKDELRNVFKDAGVMIFFFLGAFRISAALFIYI